jgi:ribosomal protein L37E
MVKRTVRIPATPITLKERETYKCLNGKCNGLLVPFELAKTSKGLTVYTTCYVCNKKYNIEYAEAKIQENLPSIQKFTWKCPRCGENSLNIRKATGTKTKFLVESTCESCKKDNSKSIDRAIYHQLVTSHSNKQGVTLTSMGGDNTPAASRSANSFPRYIICPNCQLEIEDEFKGYCPGCGLVFSIDT